MSQKIKERLDKLEQKNKLREEKYRAERAALISKCKHDFQHKSVYQDSWDECCWCGKIR